ncbi:MAG TPA: VCBS repeat-containing protein, partial [Anaerolineae bacterium]
NVFVAYDQGNPFQGQLLTTTVRQQIASNGSSGLPNAPTWFSSDSGGTLGQAWGDYDRDGSLDLALASSVGTTIYHNDKGTMKIAMSNLVQSYGVTWADVDGDGLLELIAVGDSVDKTAISQGVNYIYHFVPATGKFVLFNTFQSPLQFARIAAADLTGTGRVDLVGSTNAINVKSLPGQCAVYVYHNDGTGMFNDMTRWQCVSNVATAAIGLGDFRNLGRPDLVLGEFPNGIVKLQNTSSYTLPLTPTISAFISFAPPTVIDPSITFLPYGFSVGDFDGDGLLDLAAAYPLQREARVYRNVNKTNFVLSATLRTNVFWTPLSIDWGDFTGSGQVDLLVGDLPPKIYHYSPQANRFKFLGELAPGSVSGQVWDIRAVQTRQFQDQSIALADRDQASMLFDGAIPHLSRSLITVDPRGNPESAGSVALGDITGSGLMDILYGSSGGNIGSRVYYNDGIGFPTFSSPNPSAVLGPEHVALADIAGNGKLQLAIGSAVDVRVYKVFDGSLQPQIISPPDGGPYTVAWGDSDGDGMLDLLVGTNGHVYVFPNVSGTISGTPSWISNETCKTTSLAWADYDHRKWLGFAIGCDDQPARLYRNSTRNSFTNVWSAPYISHTTAVAWADYDASGYPSLAVANRGDHTVIYQNSGGTLSRAPVWSSPTMSQTTSMAWGDWNNDGYPELALGNIREPVQVFANLKSKPGQPRLAWIWSSSEAGAVTGVAWGDVTNNGYQDLVVSSMDANANGYYPNGSTLPSQFTSFFTPTLRLPIEPPNVTLRRPGNTFGAYFYSSAELLGS